MLPSYLEGRTGLIKETGACTFIPDPDNDCRNRARTLLYSAGFGVPSGLILISYIFMIIQVLASDNNILF